MLKEKIKPNEISYESLERYLQKKTIDFEQESLGKK